MATGLRDDLMNVDAKAQARLIATRRELHERPEVSLHEEHTADYIANYLDRLPVRNLKMRVGGHGVVTEVKGKLPGRSVLVRADIDGLPLEEATDLPFRSKNHGVMHACGHDVHMAIVLGLADSLAVNQDRLPGMVRFDFQPAEETAGG